MIKLFIFRIIQHSSYNILSNFRENLTFSFYKIIFLLFSKRDNYTVTLSSRVNKISIDCY